MPSLPRARSAAVDVLIIGAGQAGLAAGYALRNTGLSYLLLERHPRVGASWRNRYDSLKLFSSREFSALPGAPVPGDPNGYPTKDEIADYLEHYARKFSLPVSTGEGVVSLRHQNNGFAVCTSLGRIISARAVIITTGAFQRSRVPAFAGEIGPRVFQLTADRYLRPSQLPSGRTLVVGGGATGRQIVHELASTRDVWLSVSRDFLVTPARFCGKDVMWWFDKIGALTADKASLFGRMMQTRDSFPGLHLRLSALRDRGVRVARALIAANNTGLYFADGAHEAFDTVIWAIGYRDDSSWLQIAGATDAHGNYVQDRGVSPVRGLFYLGRHWQNTRSSALLCGVGREAAALVGNVTRFVTRNTCV